VDAAWSRFRGSTARLDQLPRDGTITRLIDEIKGLADQVQRETDDNAAEGVFAEAIARGLTGDPNDILLKVSGLVHIATQWDIDAAAARALFAVP
jgi:hypothetical protein